MIRLTAGTAGLLHEYVEGLVLPVAFGRNYQVPVIPVQTPLSDRLAVAIDWEDSPPGPNNPDIVLSDPTTFDKWPVPGVVQIDQEVFIYYGKDTPNLTLTTVWRAEVAHCEPHSAGATVYFRGAYTGPTVEIGTPFDFASLAPLRFKGVIAWNPRMVHFHRAVLAVYQNGVRLDLEDEARAIVAVDLDDRDVFPGYSVVSITVDLVGDYHDSGPGALPGAPPYPPFVRGQQFPRGTPIERRYLGPPPAVRGDPRRARRRMHPISGGSGSMTTWIDQPGTNLPPMPIWASKPPIPLEVGTLTVDLDGVEDDVDGTVSGTPNLWLELPHDVTRCLLREAYGLFDDATWDLAGTWAAARAYQVERDDLRWHLLYTPVPFRQFQELAGYNGRAELYPEDGLWRYRAWDLLPAVAHEFTPRNTTQASHLLVPFGELVTELDVEYDGNPILRHARIESEDGLEAYGRRRGSLNLSWVNATVQSTGETYPPVYRNTTREVAKVAEAWLRTLDRQLVIASVTAPWDARHLQRQDKVTCRDLGFVDTGGVDAIDCLVRGRSYDPTTGLTGFVLVETVEKLLFSDAVALSDQLTVLAQSALVDEIGLEDALRVTIRVRLADSMTLEDDLLTNGAAEPPLAGAWVVVVPGEVTW